MYVVCSPLIRVGDTVGPHDLYSCWEPQENLASRRLSVTIFRPAKCMQFHWCVPVQCFCMLTLLCVRRWDWAKANGTKVKHEADGSVSGHCVDCSLRLPSRVGFVLLLRTLPCCGLCFVGFCGVCCLCVCPQCADIFLSFLSLALPPWWIPCFLYLIGPPTSFL